MGECSAIQNAPQIKSLQITDLPFGATHYVRQSPRAWPSPLFGQSRQRCVPPGFDANQISLGDKALQNTSAKVVSKKTQGLSSRSSNRVWIIAALLLSPPVSSVPPVLALAFFSKGRLRCSLQASTKLSSCIFLWRARELQSQALQITKALQK